MGRHSGWGILKGEAPTEPFQPTPCWNRTVLATHVGSWERSPSSVSSRTRCSPQPRLCPLLTPGHYLQRIP
ncbi:hypothetical protein HRbin15_01685 [bacterium HR15]|nr:hypothetical protein HRbin15_01685 [bacterium HR15]